MSVALPLFVFEDGDLDVVPGIEELNQAIEPCDVSDRLEVFDASGAALQIHAEGVRESRFTVGGGEIVFDGLDPRPDAATRFRTLLSRYVQAVGTSRLGLEGADLDEVPLDQLVDQVASFFD